MLPLNGTLNTPFNTPYMLISESKAIAKIVGMILAINISHVLTGVTSNCSIVPCSFSLTIAAAVTSKETIVIMLKYSSILMNHELKVLGLNSTLVLSSMTGRLLKKAI